MWTATRVEVNGLALRCTAHSHNGTVNAAEFRDAVAPGDSVKIKDSVLYVQSVKAERGLYVAKLGPQPPRTENEEEESDDEGIEERSEDNGGGQGEDA